MRLAIATLAGLALLITPTIAQGPPFPVFPKKEEPKKAPKAEKRAAAKKGPPPEQGEAWRYRYRGPVIKHGGDLYRWDRKDDRYEQVRNRP